MSERKADAEIVQKHCTNNTCLIDEAEIIDVSAFDFDDTDGWLYVPTRYQTESKVQDLYAWLKSEPELNLSGKRSVDTRTFTRSKKRSSRTSFESIFETLSSPVLNIWKASNLSNVENLNKYSDIPTANKDEAVPSMLKMAHLTNVSLLADEAASSSGQESMEVFLNMSHSKGIDSFINLMEPGLADPLMNVSQPSVFYSSITSLSKDDSLHSTECDKEEESLNVTRTYNKDKNSNMNETFCKNDESFCLNPTDRTFTNECNTVEKMELNETYDAKTVTAELAARKSDKDNTTATSLSSTIVNKVDEKDLFKLNATYSAKEIDKVPADAMSTFRKDKDQPYDVQTNANSSFSLHDDVLNSTFKLPLQNQSTPKNTEALNSTCKANKNLESSRVYNTTWTSNFKAPTSLRKELLAEIHRSGDHRLDCTYNHTNKEHHDTTFKKDVTEEAPRLENKYNTYIKEPSTGKIKPEIDTANETVVQSLQDKRYHTFTKKNNAHGGKTDMENAESLETVDATFVKPLPKSPKRKQHIPRMLSKLPQFLQKSNPNLVSSSLRTVNTTGCTNASAVGYTKGSQPNIVRDVEKSLTNKLYSLGKVKSGSEQRLLELNSGIGDLRLLGAGGSTESIESTQSAHSAPDLDDRLSTCSDSSHKSCTMQPMNIEQFQQIVRMQEESLKQDTRPQLNRRALENTWIEMKKDLPSPIVKNGIDGCESDDSPLSIDFPVKTSSPILSPTRSSQSINTDGQSTETITKHQNDTDLKKVEAFNKPTMKIENKTRLRPPTNWNAGNRPANPMSAIPRPPSRIPGPRFVRPTVKNTQGDVKRGYM